MTIFATLRQGHEQQRLLLKILAQTHGDTEARREYFEELKDSLKHHSKAKERHFYSPLLAKDKALELSRQGIAKHEKIDALLEKLSITELSSPAWLHHLKKLKEHVEDHLSDEEQEIFQVAGKVLNENEQQQLAACYKKELTEQA